MSETPNLDELRDLNRRLALLLEDPRPGLFSWQSFLAGILEKMAEFTPYPSTMRELLDACEAAFNWIRYEQYQGTGEGPYLEQLKAAIEKAKGAP